MKTITVIHHRYGDVLEDGTEQVLFVDGAVTVADLAKRVGSEPFVLKVRTAGRKEKTLLLDGDFHG